MEQLDWKRLLFAVLDAVGEQEGVIFDADWEHHGMTAEERQAVLAVYEEHCGAPLVKQSCFADVAPAH